MAEQKTNPVVAESAATKPEAPQSGTSDAVVAYLENQLATANRRIAELESILYLYRDHAVAVAELTKAVFEEQKNADG